MFNRAALLFNGETDILNSHGGVATRGDENGLEKG
jgi:hypothetical protein